VGPVVRREDTQGGTVEIPFFGLILMPHGFFSISNFFARENTRRPLIEGRDKALRHAYSVRLIRLCGQSFLKIPVSSRRNLPAALR
jgi:hypothetical protein